MAGAQVSGPLSSDLPGTAAGTRTRSRAAGTQTAACLWDADITSKGLSPYATMPGPKILL